MILFVVLMDKCLYLQNDNTNNETCMKDIDELRQKAISLTQRNEFNLIEILLDEKVLLHYNDSELYFICANACFNLNKIELSEKYIDTTLQLDSQHSNAYCIKGNILFLKRKFEESISCYRKSIELDSQNSYSFNGIGYVYLEQEEYIEAIRCFSVSLKIDSANASTYNGLGNAYSHLLDFEKAIESYNKSIQLDPNYLSPLIGLGHLFYENREFQKAIHYFNLSLKLDPNSELSYNGLANVYAQTNEIAKSIDFYKKALELNPKFLFAYNGLGNVLKKTLNYEDAIIQYNKAIEIDTKYIAPYVGLGSLYLEKKEYDKAIEFYNKAIEINPNNRIPYNNLGQVYYEIKQYDNSLKYYQKYLELIPSENFDSFVSARISEINKFLESDIYKDISELVNKIKELLIFKDESITHYTSLSATKALILGNSKFRLSEGAFLNDTSEGRELFRHLAIPVSKKIQDTESILFAQKPFIGSFVTETMHDDLTLWRMYGKEDKEEAKGCAITFDMEGLLKNLKDMLTTDNSVTDTASIDEEFTLYRVAYRKSGTDAEFIIPGAEDKEQILKEFMIELSKKVKKFTSTKEDMTFENKDLIERLNEIAYLFKSIEYQHENEIRLVVKGIGFEKVINGESPKVYIELVPIRLLIKKITLGPKVEKAEEWAAAFYYSLEKDRLQPCIHISHLPYK